MQKIISLFQRNYDGDRLVRDEVVPGAEWVLAGEGIATRKWDGTCCMVRHGVLFRRYDRKLTKKAGKRRRSSDGDMLSMPIDADYKPAPANWEPAEDAPNRNTGHWPGWIPVGDEPESQWHAEGFANTPGLPDGTYELVGPKVQKNAEGFQQHRLLRHGLELLKSDPRNFEDIKLYLGDGGIEGIVWHHPDGRMVKIKAKDFGVTR